MGGWEALLSKATILEAENNVLVCSEISMMESFLNRAK